MFIVSKMPRSISAESYRSIRTSINYSSVDRKIKTIVVTSSIAGEGKSTVSGNLACILSENKNKVLIIDCDLRKPSLHKKFKVSNEIGITDILVNKCTEKEAIMSVDKGVDLITAGTLPPNPAEVIGSNTLKRFIDEMALRYDYVVIDTPPVMAVTDAQLLAAKCDGTVLVVRAKKTKGKYVKSAYNELEKVRANIIGSILNGADLKQKYGYYKHYSEDSGRKFKLIR